MGDINIQIEMYKTVKLILSEKEIEKCLVRKEILKLQH